MSKLGFYGWIREGVRRAVLLGLSDAMEQVGNPADNQELHPQLAALLHPQRHAPVGQAATAPGLATIPVRPAREHRKRLGKSFADMNQQPPTDSEG